MRPQASTSPATQGGPCAAKNRHGMALQHAGSESKRHAATNGQPARNRHAQKTPQRRSITGQRCITERRKATGCIRVRDQARIRIYNQGMPNSKWINTINCTSHFTRLRPRIESAHFRIKNCVICEVTATFILLLTRAAIRIRNAIGFGARWALSRRPPRVSAQDGSSCTNGSE